MVSYPLFSIELRRNTPVSRSNKVKSSFNWVFEFGLLLLLCPLESHAPSIQAEARYGSAIDGSEFLDSFAQYK